MSHDTVSDDFFGNTELLFPDPVLTHWSEPFVPSSEHVHLFDNYSPLPPAGVHRRCLVCGAWD